MSDLFFQLGIEWPVLIAQVVNFAILLFILGRFVYRPVMRLLDERRDAVAAAARREEEVAKRFSETESERERMLAAARSESERIIKSGKQAGAESGEKMIAAAREEISRMERESEKKIASERARLVAAARKEIGSVVVGAVERSFGDVLDARAQGKMVEQALRAIREDEEAERSAHSA